MSSDLEEELELLRTTLEMKGAELHDVIKGESQRKEAELQVRDSFRFVLFPSLNSGYFFLKLLILRDIVLYYIIILYYI